MTDFREWDCPARGPALSHMQSATEAPDGRCLHCGEVVIGPRCPQRGWKEGHDFSMVTSRCRYCGAAFPLLDEAAERDPIQEARDHVFREAGLPPDSLIDPGSIPSEPRLATGDLGGIPWGRGRSWRGDGALGPRDRERLEFYCFTVRDGLS